MDLPGPTGVAHARIPAPALADLHQVAPEVFAMRMHAVMSKPPHSCYLTPYSVGEYRMMRCFQADGGRIGGAIVDRGYGRQEIVSVYNVGSRAGGGWEMVDALVAMGGNYIECFRGYLSDGYAKRGFVEIGSEPWNPRLAPDDWDVSRGGTPDLVQMAFTQPRR
jgi:hypothetical protein